MDPILLAVLALSILAIALRSFKAQDRIDWKSRIELLLLATCVCLISAHWLHSSLLEAAEQAAATGRFTHPLSMRIAPHFDPVLMPIYIAVTAVVIDLLSRIVRRFLTESEDRHLALWRTVGANVIVFVLTPGLLYAWTIAFATSGSMISDAAQEGIAPFVTAYAAPAHWLEGVVNSGASSYPASSAHSFTGATREWTLRARFWTDASPWFALSVLLACSAAIFRSKADRRQFIEFFFERTAKSSAISLRALLNTWRGIAVVCFTAAWIAFAKVSQWVLELTLGLQYILFSLLILIGIAVFIGIPYLIFSKLRARRSKQ